MQGVALQSAEFEEPARRGAAAPERRPLAAMLRSQRFQEVLSALELLLQWTKVERSNFQQKVLGVELASNARRYNAPQNAMRSSEDVELAERIVEEPTFDGVQTAAGVQTSDGIQMAAGVQTAVGVESRRIGVQRWRPDDEPGSKKTKA